MRTKERGGGTYVTFKEGAVLDVARAFELIKAGGFKPRANEVSLYVTGTVTSENSQYLLNLDRVKAPTRFALLESSEKGGAEAFARLKELVAQNSAASLEIEGAWQASANPSDSKSPPTLRVTSVTIAKAKPGK